MKNDALLENLIESKFRKLQIISDSEYSALYANIKHNKLKNILITIHSDLVTLLNAMNTRLPTRSDAEAHYWADESRKLKNVIEVSESLYKELRNSHLSFEIDGYYKNLFSKCMTFLTSSGGSKIPSGMDKVNIYYTIPIFTNRDTINTDAQNHSKSFDLHLIGEGSYAQVFKFEDDFYNKTFALKRARKNLDSKEIIRFKREFEAMRDLHSPYIVKAYRYRESTNEYIMEFMDKTLEKYISSNNAKITHEQRRSIGNQILKAFIYIHSKGLLHRDISPKNVLLREYDDTLVVKISDFGLVKTANSHLTSANTEVKGSFNDPALHLEGFENYDKTHEIYALTRLLFYVMTGRTNTDKVTGTNLRLMINTGMNTDRSKRYQNIEELIAAFRNL